MASWFLLELLGIDAAALCDQGMELAPLKLWLPGEGLTRAAIACVPAGQHRSERLVVGIQSFPDLLFGEDRPLDMDLAVAVAANTMSQRGEAFIQMSLDAGFAFATVGSYLSDEFLQRRNVVFCAADHPGVHPVTSLFIGEKLEQTVGESKGRVAGFSVNPTVEVELEGQVVGQGDRRSRDLLGGHDASVRGVCCAFRFERRTADPRLHENSETGVPLVPKRAPKGGRKSRSPGSGG